MIQRVIDFFEEYGIFFWIGLILLVAVATCQDRAEYLKTHHRVYKVYDLSDEDETDYLTDSISIDGAGCVQFTDQYDYQRRLCNFKIKQIK